MNTASAFASLAPIPDTGIQPFPTYDSESAVAVSRPVLVS